MKAKTIKSVFRNKLKAWCASIEDEAVSKAVAENTIFTGGAIASMLLKEKVNDYDVYFRDRATTLLVAQYYLTRFKMNPPTVFKDAPDHKVEIYLADGYNHPIKDGHNPSDELSHRINIVVKSSGAASEGGATNYAYFEGSPDSADAEEFADAVCATVEGEKAVEKTADGKPPFRPIFLSSNAITLSDDIQIVVRFWGEPDQIHENYDFVHCMNYWTSWDGELVLKPDALESLLTRELRYVGSKYPLCSIIRTRKFIQRQWTINAGQYLKMAMQLGDLDLNNINVLEDQLTGVDAAYFNQIIRLIKEKITDNTAIDRAYLIELIDRLF